VHYEEPPSYGELLSDPRLILAPHIGGSTFEAHERMKSRVLEILKEKGYE